MNIQDKIDDLLAKAEPFRSMEDDDETKRPLTGIVDEINKLRALQAEGKDFTDALTRKEESEIGDVKRGIEDAYNRPAKRGEAEHVLRLPKRGRPARVEGSDAE